MANKTLLAGHMPFVVTDALEGWPAMDRWRDLDYLKKKV